LPFTHLLQLPSFNDLSIVSLVGALMSVCYCSIATILAAMHRPGPETPTNYTPGHGLSATEHTFGVFNAITTMLFAYGGHNIALEVQATLPSPPSTVGPMMKGVNAAFVLTGVCYLLVTVTGFHAFGVGVPDNVLAGFGGDFGSAVAVANLMVVLHVAAAYQVFTQPVFDSIESSMAAKLGKKPNVIYRVAMRTLYVAVLTFVAIVVPFFGSLMGLVGAIGITPTTFLLPCLLWVMKERPPTWSFSWVLNWGLVGVTACVGMLGAIGACYSLVHQASSFSLLAGLAD
jgi:amino acid permease